MLISGLSINSSITRRLRVTLVRPQLHSRFRCITSWIDRFQEGDRVILNRRDDNIYLTQPLQAEGVTHTRWGDVEHSNIIGKPTQAQVTTVKGRSLSASQPTLAQYTTLTPRLVTPVYSADANLIVSLLDIHATAVSDGQHDGPSLEILEAGTGHGALTLHLARAIHAANASIPVVEGSQEQPVTTYPKETRKATVHTVELSRQNSEHAKKVVQGFRRGLYSNDVDFYVGSVSDWIDQQIDRRQLRGKDDKAFLSHIILDMPGSYKHMEKAASVLLSQGTLVLFNPSITQIIDAVETIRKHHIPVYLDRVLELGHTMTGGKEWDVRAFKPRAVAQAEQEKRISGERNGPRTDVASNEDEPGSSEESSSEGSDETLPADNEKADKLAKEVQGFETICRPKAFSRVVGGGFVGVWKKKTPRDL